MATRVIFHLTAQQAAAIEKLAAGERIAAFLGRRGRPWIIEALRRRGLINEYGLTPLGRAAAVLVDQIRRASDLDIAPADDGAKG